MMIKLDITYYSLDKLYDMRLSNRLLNYKTLGVVLGEKTKLCSLLYKEKKLIKAAGYDLYVNPNSYDANRLPIIEFIIDEIIEHKQLDHASRGIKDSIRFYFIFVNWLDENNIDFPKTIAEGSEIYYRYTSYLLSKVELAQATVSRYQTASCKLLAGLLNDKESIIYNSAPNITKNTKSKNITKVPQQDQVNYHFKFYYELFMQLTSFLLEEKPYPFQLSLPKEKLWIWHGRPWVVPSHREHEHKMTAFDYKNGTLLSAEHLFEKFKYQNIYLARGAIKQRIKQLEFNNQNKTKARLQLGQVALRAFYMIFLYITGMNDSTAATLKWNDDFTIEKEQQRFRTIKYRAGNKPVEFLLQKEFMPEFKKFLHLRQYLLDSHMSEYLFFMRYRESAYLSYKQTSGAFSGDINRYMTKYIDNELPGITSRQIRKYKLHDLIKKNDIVTASKIAQSSINTVLSSYNGVSEETAEQQLGNFFTKLNENILINNDDTTDISCGQCKDYQNPKPLFNTESIVSDCNRMEGCLFCIHYGLHPDEIDIRKIISMEYVINQCRYISQDIKHFETVFSPYLKRIENIILNLRSKNIHLNKIIDTITIDVYELENLSDYWSYSLEKLISLGLIK